jgi:hypothetical protein
MAGGPIVDAPVIWAWPTETVGACATDGIAAAGGTSGIIDNESTTQTGAAQIYYSTPGGDDAVQTSQSAP